MTSLLDGLPAWPQDDFSAYGPVRVEPIGRFQQVTGRMLHRNWVAIPHVVHHDELDITDLEDRRSAWNAENPSRKITPLVPLIQAVARVLGDYPHFRASLDSTASNLMIKDYIHIGVAVDTPGGLLVPVLRDCDKRGAQDLAAELSAVSRQAREKGLSMAAMSGGCITISSLGHIGGTGFSPIINAPQVAIIGVSRTQQRPCRGPSSDSDLIWRTMLPVSLSYDHRVINGADAARFCVSLGQALAIISNFQ